MWDEGSDLGGIILAPADPYRLERCERAVREWYEAAGPAEWALAFLLACLGVLAVLAGLAALRSAVNDSRRVALQEDLRDMRDELEDIKAQLDEEDHG